MKIFFYTSILIAILLQSCFTKDPYGKDYIGPGYAIGTAEKRGNISFITTEDTCKIVMKNINFPDSIVNERVFTEGYLYHSNGGFDYALDVVIYAIVPIKEAQFVNNQDTIDLVNNANVAINNNRIWQTGKYLNLSLIYYAAEPQKHSFYFLINKQIENFENNRVTINICHNNDRDVALNYKTKFFSLDLTNLFEKFTDDFDIKFVYIENSQKKEIIISSIKRY